MLKKLDLFVSLPRFRYQRPFLSASALASLYVWLLEITSTPPEQLQPSVASCCQERTSCVWRARSLTSRLETTRER